MAKGDYLDRQRKAQQTYLDIGEEMGMQKMWDYVQIALRDPDVMGKDILGKARLEKVYKKLGELADHYKTAFTDDVEADFRQEELDGVLREVWGDELSVFKDRYPYLKEQKYNKGKDKWR
jgi:hypothetical protein